MNVRLEYQTRFSAGVVYNDQYEINHYDLTINMLTNTVDTYEQNVAFDRIKYWIHNIVDSSVFINQDNELVTAFQQTSQRVLILPDEPYDQIIELMMFVKLDAIVEGKMIITDIRLSSTLGDNMFYLHNEEESVGPFSSDGWWTLLTPQWFSNTTNKKKVVSITETPRWEDIDLSWSVTDNTIESTIVFANFTKNETK